MTDRSNELTDSDDLNTDATSGSRTTATVRPFIKAAKPFGRVLRYSKRYSGRISARAGCVPLRLDVLFMVLAFSLRHLSRAENPRVP